MAQTHTSVPGIRPTIDAQTIVERIKDVVTFKRSTVTRIAADRSASIESGIVVAIVGLATAIGYQSDVVAAIAAALIGWAGLSGAIWYIADRFMGTPTSRESFLPLIRTIGYAQAPASLAIIHFMWGLGPMVAGIGTLWSFAATVFAVRCTTHFGWPRTIVLTIAGGIIVNVAGFVISLIFGIEPQIW